MKNVTLLFTLLCTLFGAQAMAQITITKANFPVKEEMQDSAIIAAENGLPMPSVGEAQTWDYGNLTSSGWQYLRNYVGGAGDNSFDNDFNYYSLNWNFQAFEFPGTHNFGLDDDGYFFVGRTAQRSAFSITAISGGPNDSLVFPKQAREYIGRTDAMKFPATYGDKWSQTRIEYTDFRLTVAAFALNNVPGSAKRYQTETREVVGYGTLKAPMQSGGSSRAFDVILVKVNRSNIDTFFLGGQLAPPSLLAAFGIAQGITAADEFYEFYREDVAVPVVKIYVEGGSVSEVTFNYMATRGMSTSIEKNHSNSQVSAYPNPVSVGGVITISAKENNGGTSYLQIMDASGKVVANQSNLTAGINGFQFQVPADFTSGMYFYNIVSGDGAQKTTGRFQVR